MGVDRVRAWAALASGERVWTVRPSLGWVADGRVEGRVLVCGRRLMAPLMASRVARRTVSGVALLLLLLPELLA